MPERVFGGDQNLVAPALDSGAQDFFRRARGIDVRAIEHVQACIQADVDQPFGALGIGITPGFEEVALAAKSTGAKGENRDLESRTAEQAVFHDLLHRRNRRRLAVAMTVSTATASGVLRAQSSGSARFSRPPTRTGSIRVASPLPPVCTNTPHKVAGPVAGA